MLTFARVLEMSVADHDLAPVLLYGAEAPARAAQLRAGMMARGCGVREPEKVGCAPAGSKGIDQRRQVGVVELPSDEVAQHHYKYVCERSTPYTWWIFTAANLHGVLPGLRSLCMVVACPAAASHDAACPAFEADLDALLTAHARGRVSKTATATATALPQQAFVLAALRLMIDKHIAKGTCLRAMTHSVLAALGKSDGGQEEGFRRAAEITAELDHALAVCKRPLMYGLIFERAVARVLLMREGRQAAAPAHSSSRSSSLISDDQ